MSASGGRGGRFKSPKLEELLKNYSDTNSMKPQCRSRRKCYSTGILRNDEVEVYPLDRIFFDDVQMKAFKDHNPAVFKPFDIVIRRQVADSKKKKLLTLVILMILILGISSIFIATVFIRLYRQRLV
jgi:DNA polymerase-3 subunit alpha